MKTKLAPLLQTLLVFALLALTACSTAQVSATNTAAQPFIAPAIQAAATYAISKDASLKPDLQTVLSALQDVQATDKVITPAVLTDAVDFAFTKAGSSAAHVTYLNGLFAPYLADVAADLPDAITGLNAALNPTAVVAVPVAAPAKPAGS